MHPISLPFSKKRLGVSVCQGLPRATGKRLVTTPDFDPSCRSCTTPGFGIFAVYTGQRAKQLCFCVLRTLEVMTLCGTVALAVPQCRKMIVVSRCFECQLRVLDLRHVTAVPATLWAFVSVRMVLVHMGSATTFRCV